MVAITGDTAASSFRMMLFMVLSSCGLRRHSVEGGTAAHKRVAPNIRLWERVRRGTAGEIERKEKREEGWGVGFLPGRATTGWPGGPRAALGTPLGPKSC